MKQLELLAETWRGPDTPEPPLRDYQRAGILLLDQAWNGGAKAPLLVLPTGGGKTRMAAKLISREEAREVPTAFLAPRRELVYQAYNALKHYGVHAGVVMSGAEHMADKWARCQVASIDTVLARTRHDRIPLPLTPQLVVIDEAHLSITEKRTELFKMWPNARLVGLTATPSRKDGKALGILYDKIIEPATTAGLTERGFLCPARCFSLYEPDLKGVKTTAGDYNQRQLEGVMLAGELVGDIVEHWLRLAADRRTVVFATSIAHSIALAERFQAAGVKAEHVDANTPVDERTATFNRFSNGDTQVLTNCFLAAYGFDLPELDCVVMARPTKSMVLYLQSIGRGLRIAEGKKDCLVLDHSGCVIRFGFPTDAREWTLEGKLAIKKPKPRESSKTESDGKVVCPNCAFVFASSAKCPDCGHILRRKPEDVMTRKGSLVEITVDGRTVPLDSPDGREQFYQELRGYCVEKSWRQGWAAHKYKEKFDRYPPWDWANKPWQRPGLQTRRWIKSRMIAYAKAREKETKLAAAR